MYDNKSLNELNQLGSRRDELLCVRYWNSSPDASRLEEERGFLKTVMAGWLAVENNTKAIEKTLREPNDQRPCMPFLPPVYYTRAMHVYKFPRIIA
jgi:hypothetical protein